MTSVTFDTLKYANRLKGSGMAPDQAEAQAEALAEVLEVNLKELATKGDLMQIRQELIQLEQRMTIKLGTMLTVAVGATVALIKLL